MGSCFAEHIGRRLSGLKFQQQLNPYGIVYNPLVLARLLRKLLREEPPREAELFQEQGLWRHYDFHSRYAQPEPTDALLIMRQQQQRAVALLPQLDYLLLTLGTAYGFARKSNGEWVNNCHQQDADLFVKQRATVAETVGMLRDVFIDLQTRSPKLQVILTVSPVRYQRDGFLENQRSKAILLLAVEGLTQELPFVHYFPAYEILLDELRDYRFYARDMLHSNELAIDYIWEAFTDAFWTDETRQLSSRIHKVVQSLQHRPLHPGSDSHQAFQQQLREQVQELQTAYPFLSFAHESQKIKG